MNLIKVSEKEISKKINTYKTEKGLEIVETIENGKLKSVNIKEDKNFGFPYILNLPENWIEEYDDFYKLYEYRKDIKSIEDLKEEEAYFLYSSGHMLFDANKKIVSIPYTFNYIGSLEEKCENDAVYKKLIEALKKHPYVLEIEEKEIEYYNSDFDGQKGISLAKVYIPQEKYEQLYNKYKETEYWSISMGNEMKMNLITDLYGEEIENLLKKYYNIIGEKI